MYVNKMSSSCNLEVMCPQIMKLMPKSCSLSPSNINNIFLLVICQKVIFQNRDTAHDLILAIIFERVIGADFFILPLKTINSWRKHFSHPSHGIPIIFPTNINIILITKFCYFFPKIFFSAKR